MTMHTPGPWLFRTVPTSTGLCHIVSAADWKGAFIYGNGIKKGVDDALPKAQELAANARLIAAAPDLLEALREMCAMWRSVCSSQGWDPELFAEAVRAQAAIARATGEQP